jgi:transposase
MPQVWQLSHLTRQQLEERRLAIQPFLLNQSRTTTSLAEDFGVKPGTIRTWRRRLQARGSLEATRTTGRPTRLTDTQVAEVLETLQRGPDLERFPDGRWTTHRVREVIGLQYDVWYDHDWVGKLLHRWGFSWEKAEKRALEQNPEQIEAWLEAGLPASEKKVDAGETLVWADEVGFRLKPSVGNTWATRGRTPLNFAKTSWTKLSTIGGITSNGQFLQQTHKGSIKTPQVIAYLTHLLRHLPGSVTVVLDNASIHRAKAVQNFVRDNERLSIVFLPPYAPELNPVELVWAYVKRYVLANLCPETVDTLKAYLRSAWQKVRSRRLPAKLLGITEEFRT